MTPLGNYNMTYENNASAYSAESGSSSGNSFYTGFGWTTSGDENQSGAWGKDALDSLYLTSASARYELSELRVGGLAGAVFGRQLQEGYQALHSTKISGRERMRLYREHMAKLDEWRNVMLNQLYFARRPYSGQDRRQIAQLERMLLQLEGDERQEQLAFWKDMTDLRKEAIEAKFEYQASHERFNLLGGLKEQDGGASLESRAD
jgi:hypothetical protein